jgi:hypothetical protein
LHALKDRVQDDQSVTTDAYNLDVNVLGPHPNEFYGAVGRIVCVSAVIEQQISAMRHALAHVQQGTYSHEQVSDHIRAARKLAKSLPEQDGQRVRAFLKRAERAFDKRNDVVHSAFPAQEDGRIYGHRPIRDKAVTDGTSTPFETTMPELKEFIGRLSGLAREFNSVHALCSYRSPAALPQSRRSLIPKWLAPIVDKPCLLLHGLLHRLNGEPPRRRCVPFGDRAGQ